MCELLTIFKSIPATVWAALGTAITAFCGVALTNWNSRESLKIQLKHSASMQQLQVSRERLEEAYSLLGQWGSIVFTETMYYSAVIEGNVEREEFDKKKIEIRETPVRFDFNRLEMIIGIYGEPVKDLFSTCVTLRNDLSKIRRSHEKNMPNEEQSEQFLHALSEAFKSFDTALRVLKSNIVNSVQNASV